MKKSEETKCDNRNMTLMKANHNGSILSQDFTRNIFELREPKTGGKQIV